MEIKHLYLALALLATTFSMPGCDGDDDDDAKPDTEVDGGDSSDKDGDSTDKDGDSNTDKDGDSSSDTYNTPDKSVGGTVPTIAEAVDLGLTSGTLWAPYNVGATAPGEAGAYFAWGETTAKSDYRWSTYKWTEDGGSTFTKYTTNGLTSLKKADDATVVNWGGKWVMPTVAQLTELFYECNYVWKAKGEYAEGALDGYLLTSKTNGNTLFLPAAGYRWDANLDGVGSRGDYWSAELTSSYSGYARSLDFRSGYWISGNGGRSYGFSVRPVCPSAE